MSGNARPQDIGHYKYGTIEDTIEAVREHTQSNLDAVGRVLETAEEKPFNGIKLVTALKVDLTGILHNLGKDVTNLTDVGKIINRIEMLAVLHGYDGILELIYEKLPYDRFYVSPESDKEYKQGDVMELLRSLCHHAETDASVVVDVIPRNLNTATQELIRLRDLALSDLPPLQPRWEDELLDLTTICKQIYRIEQLAVVHGYADIVHVITFLRPYDKGESESIFMGLYLDRRKYFLL